MHIIISVGTRPRVVTAQHMHIIISVGTRPRVVTTYAHHHCGNFLLH